MTIITITTDRDAAHWRCTRAVLPLRKAPPVTTRDLGHAGLLAVATAMLVSCGGRARPA